MGLLRRLRFGSPCARLALAAREQGLQLVGRGDGAHELEVGVTVAPPEVSLPPKNVLHS